MRVAGPDDVARFGALLAGAFDADPFVRWLVGDRCASLEPLYRALVGVNLVDEAPDGVAVWRPVGRRRSMRESLALLAATVRTTGLARFFRLLPAFLEIDRRHPRGDHAELVALGVAGSARGRGVATRLLESALADLDARGTPAALETSNERNLPLYERHGFRIAERLAIPSGPSIWFMRRASDKNERGADP